MTVIDAIQNRRAYRSLDPAEIARETADHLATCAGLAPSCFNKQPWRFVFVRSPESLRALRDAINKGNEWTFASSLIAALYTRTDLDCVVKEREYALFDTGMAAAFFILRATELGLVAHPIAGFDEAKARDILGIPPEYRLITLINVGRHSSVPSPVLSEKQLVDEGKRPERLPLEKFVSYDRYEVAGGGN